jgi:hypothetical protein
MTTCRWDEDDIAGVWRAACGRVFEFTAASPSDNGFRFCPYCGGVLVELPAIPEMNAEPGSRT